MKTVYSENKIVDVLSMHSPNMETFFEQAYFFNYAQNGTFIAASKNTHLNEASVFFTA